MIDDGTIAAITEVAEQSAISDYEWPDRGVAPLGYMKGMAVAFATVLRKWKDHDGAALQMAHKNTHLPDVDVLSWYDGVFNDLGMFNEQSGINTLRHLFALQLGLGMRELSGQHCCGRDMSADNVTADTAEAGLFQMSWNMRSCSPVMPKLLHEYNSKPGEAAAWLKIFSEDVECDADDWSCYGTGAGREYQKLAKLCPMFAVETAAVGLRKRRQHWGPINRYEAEVRPEADQMFADVQALVLAPEV